MITAKILLDSITEHGHRLTTWELMYPRFIHSEFMTHRCLSKNAASSRAMPLDKMIKAIEDNPALPEHWGAEQKGMQSGGSLEGEKLEEAQWVWQAAMEGCILKARRLQRAGLHKSLINRILEPWAHITVICSGTDWANFYNLRAHKDAQPEFQVLAKLMKEKYLANEPKLLKMGEWHLPMVDHNEFDLETSRKISVGRCARVSYLTHDGVRDPNKDVELHDKLVASYPKHLSPTEHQATPNFSQRVGNFKGWTQYRKQIADENMTVLHD